MIYDKCYCIIFINLSINRQFYVILEAKLTHMVVCGTQYYIYNGVSVLNNIACATMNIGFSLRLLRQWYRFSSSPFPTPIVESFRCMPSDFMPSMHMNNAMLFRYGELTRWRITAQSGLMPATKWRYPVVEQTCKYYKEILPFQKFDVATKITIMDDKWILYHHKFQQHSSDLKTIAGQSTPIPMLLAEINTRSVIKDISGKTVRLLETDCMNDFAKLTMAVEYSMPGEPCA